MKDIRALLIKILILALPLYVMMGYALLFPMSYMPVEYSMWQEEKDYVNLGESDPELLIIGDSRAKSGIIPSELVGGGINAYNIAIGGCNAIEMYYALEHYLKAHETPKRALVIFAPYHFCDIDNFGQTQSFNYLSTGELLSVYTRSLKYGESERLGEHFFTDVLSCKLRLPNKYLSSIYEARVNERKQENVKKYESVRADLGYTEFGSEPGNDNPAYEVHHRDFDSSQLVVSYYGRLLQLADENGIEVIAAQAPVNETTGEGMSGEFTKGFSDMMERFATEHPSFVVESEIPVYENRYFGDNNHLNRSGAEVFTAQLKGRYEDILNGNG